MPISFEEFLKKAAGGVPSPAPRKPRAPRVGVPAPRKPVQMPGKRGGKFYRTKKGEVVYGQQGAGRPPAKGQPAPPHKGQAVVFTTGDGKPGQIGQLIGINAQTNKVRVRTKDGQTLDLDAGRVHGAPVGSTPQEQGGAAQALGREGAPMTQEQRFLQPGGRRITAEQMEQLKLLAAHGTPINMEAVADASFEEAEALLDHFTEGRPHTDEPPPKPQPAEGEEPEKEAPTVSKARYSHPLRQVLRQLESKKFGDLVDPAVQEAGDKLITEGTSSGYNVQMYEVADREGLTPMLLGSRPYVFYNMYNGNSKHGTELLGQLHNAGLSVPYDVVAKASVVQWDDAWGDEDAKFGVEFEEAGEGEKKKLLARSVEYVIAFRPKNDEQAESLVGFFAEHCYKDKKDSVPGSWSVPDVRWNGRKKVDAYERAVINYREMGDQTLLTLTQETRLPDFRHHPVYLNPELHGFLSKAFGRHRESEPDGVLRKGWPAYVNSWDDADTWRAASREEAWF